MKYLIPELKPDEILCNKCGGVGGIGASQKESDKGKFIRVICKKCLGTGKLDWVENIKGGKETLEAEIDWYLDANENRLVNYILRTVEFILNKKSETLIFKEKRIGFYLNDLIERNQIERYKIDKGSFGYYIIFIYSAIAEYPTQINCRWKK